MTSTSEIAQSNKEKQQIKYTYTNENDSKSTIYLYIYLQSHIPSKKNIEKHCMGTTSRNQKKESKKDVYL